MLRQLGGLATVTVRAGLTPAAEVLALAPDGVFLSNGPGDPAALAGPTATVADLVGRVPVFGICLGHQVLASALGGRTYKLPFGHHGSNHPVRRLATGQVEVTSQNHNYAVDADSLASRRGDPRQPERRRGRGHRLPRAARPSRSSTTPRPARARTTPGTCSTSSRPSWPGAPVGADVPRRDDIASILVIGSGPIVIGQACEFDYSGTQACRVLMEEGYRVVLANSNPATIMTDPATADRTYVEPLDARGPGGHHRAGAARRPAAHPGRSDGPQPDHAAGRERGARRLRGGGHRGPARSHRHRRGPRPVPQGHGRDRSRGVAARASPTPWTRPWPWPRAWATRSWSARRSSWAGRAPASPPTPTGCGPWPPRAWRPARSARC